MYNYFFNKCNILHKKQVKKRINTDEIKNMSLLYLKKMQDVAKKIQNTMRQTLSTPSQLLLTQIAV